LFNDVIEPYSARRFSRSKIKLSKFTLAQSTKLIAVSDPFSGFTTVHSGVSPTALCPPPPMSL
jgi:hypothetical protein